MTTACMRTTMARVCTQQTTMSDVRVMGIPPQTRSLFWSLQPLYRFSPYPYPSRTQHQLQISPAMNYPYPFQHLHPATHPHWTRLPTIPHPPQQIPFHHLVCHLHSWCLSHLDQIVFFHPHPTPASTPILPDPSSIVNSHFPHRQSVHHSTSAPS